jgi:hypothetical protein
MFFFSNRIESKSQAAEMDLIDLTNFCISFHASVPDLQSSGSMLIIGQTEFVAAAIQTDE